MKAAQSPIFSRVMAIVMFSVVPTWTGAVPSAEVTASSPSAAHPSNSLLDGKTFSVQSGEKGKQAIHKDTLVFRNGRFLSEACNPYGFGDAPYKATVDDGTVRFHAETHSPTHGTMVWDGTVRGDTIKATNTWTRKRWYWNIKREYWYKGQLKE